MARVEWGALLQEVVMCRMVMVAAVMELKAALLLPSADLEFQPQPGP